MRPRTARGRALHGRVVAAAAMVLAAACSRPEPRVVYDLVHRASVAELRATFDAVRFGTPDTEPIQERGFQRVAGFGTGDVSADIRARATLALIFPEVAPRVAVVDLEPVPAHVGEELELAVNRSAVGAVRLEAGRHRYRFDLPAGVQRPGRNRMRLRLPAEEARRQDPTRGAPVARIYTLVAGPASDRATLALAEPGAPPVLGATEAGDHRLLTQTGPSSLRFAVLVPEAAELRFQPAIHPSAPLGASATLAVDFQTDSGAARSLWSARVTAGDPPPEVRIDLPGPAGTPAWLTLRVDEPSDPRAGRIVWSDPRVFGRGSGDPLARRALPDEDQRRADALRERLAGTNVIVVVFDAAQALHYGCYAHPHATTPAIDRLAAEGVVFERHYTPAVFTYAAVGSLFTSQYPDQDQREWVEGAQLPEDRRTLAELLSAHGITTAGFVANPSAGPGYGLDRGFGSYATLFKPPWVVGTTFPNATVFARHLHPWLEHPPQGRFFAYVHVREPHMPFGQPLAGPDAPLPPEAKRYRWYAPVNHGERDLSPEERAHLARLYDGNLAFADHELGEMRRVMEASGLLEKTVLIVSADHGEALGEHGYIGHNSQVYEESMRIPLVVRFPHGSGPAGFRVSSLTSLLDIAPTVADVFGLWRQGEDTSSFQGRSLLPLVAGSSGTAGVLARNTGRTFALVTERYKLIEDTGSGEYEMYDLDSDPRELRDVAGDEPVRASCYHQSLGMRMLDARAFAGAAEARPAQLDAQDEEMLRALGYLQ